MGGSWMLYEGTPMADSGSFEHVYILAQDRLDLYRIFINSRFDPKVSLESIMASNIVFKGMLMDPFGQGRDCLDDDLAHWILRFVYCKSGSLQRLFVRLETFWLKIQYEALLTDEIKTEFILTKCVTSLPPKASPEEVRDFPAGVSWKPGCCPYKTYFTDVPSLVAQRNCFLSKGTAYFTFNEMGVWLQHTFERFLKISLHEAADILTNGVPSEALAAACRVIIPIESHRSRFVDEILGLESLNSESEHFPLCMRYSHDFLRRTHHLKYFSRRQYGLFLKGIGLSLGNTLTLFEKEFTLKDMDSKRFNSKYSYLFKHLWGTVGSHIDYDPMSCEDILDSPVIPGPGHAHGCPFARWDQQLLEKRLSDYHMVNRDSEDLVEIRRLVEEKKYRDACGKCFESKCGVPPDEPIEHPNEYYRNCRQYGSMFCSDMEDMF